MIPIGEYGYLPGFCLGLTPFGPEYYLENYLLKGNEPIYAYLRYGRHAGHIYPGIGLEHPSLLWHGEKTTVGVRVDGWYRPHAAFNDKEYSYKSLSEKWERQETLPPSPYDPKVGLAASIMLRKQFGSSGSLFCRLEEKQSGFLPGESLEAAVTVRGGITIMVRKARKDVYFSFLKVLCLFSILLSGHLNTEERTAATAPESSWSHFSKCL